MTPSEFTLEDLLDLAKEYSHVGRVVPADAAGVLRNSVCGDQVRLSWTMEGKVIRTVRFEQQGCLLSRVFTARLCQVMEGQSLQVLRETPFAELLGFELSQLTHRRQSCATLSYQLMSLRRSGTG